MQSRTAKLSEVFRKEDFSEMADVQPGALPVSINTTAGQDTSDPSDKKIIIGTVDDRPTSSTSSRDPKGLKVAIVGRDGKTEFQDSDFKAFTRL